MRRDHFFDWHGFTFAAKVLVLCIIAGTVGRYGLLYAAQSRPSAGPSLVLIQEMRPTQKSLSLSLSTTTSEHITNTLTIADTVPPVGKFVAADLRAMVLTLYQDGVATAKYPIRVTGKDGSPYDTPAGFYTVSKKESDHFNGAEQIDLPWSVQFYANYFIHGSPYAADGSPVSLPYTGGGIQLSTDDARKVYEFAEQGTSIFVFDPTPATASLVLDAVPFPPVSAASYLVADVDTGDVFLEQKADDIFPMESATRLMVALVANNTIAFDKKIPIARSALLPAKAKSAETKDLFRAGDLLYPLLMASNDAAAESLAQAHGATDFVGWMNTTAKALDMQSTRFSDIVSTSTENVSSPDDLFRLAAYLARKKSFILDVARTPSKDLIADSGNVYHLDNTGAVKDSRLSVVSVSINGIERRTAIIVLKSKDYAADTAALADWFTQTARQGADLVNTACATCAVPLPFRKIQL